MIKKWDSQQAEGVIVIIHGAGEHHGRYEWVIEQFNRRRFNVVTGDLPGQGRTRGKKGHIDTFDQYIKTAYQWGKEAVSYGLPTFLFGHSMGGLVTIRTLMEKHLPLNGVILSSPCLSLYQYPNKMVDFASKIMHRVTPTFTAHTGMSPENVTRNPDIRAAYAKDELRVSKVSIRWYQEMLKAMRISLTEAERFPDVPLLVMQAGEDYVVDKKAAHRWFNQLETSDRSFKEWKGLYHELLNEPERDHIFQYMIQFMQQRM